MERKNKLKILVVIFAFMIVGNISSYSSEKNFMGMSQVDKDPWKIAWVHDSKTGWQISTWFEKAVVTYFFKEGPANDGGLGLSANNPPYKIEFTDLTTNKSFAIKEISYEQWGDGAKIYAGKLEKKFLLDGVKYHVITVSVVNEVNGAKNYATYSLWRDLK